MSKTKISDFIGDNLEEDFLSFDLTEIQQVLQTLQNTEAIDLSHAEILQQQALRGADVLTEYLSRLIKTIGYLENKVNSVINKAALDYKSPDGSKVTIEMRKWAGTNSPEAEAVQIKLANAKASKMLLEKKYDIITKSFYHYKEIASGIRKTILGYGNLNVSDKIPQGYE